ncbi:MAG: hypothetical protein GQF41_1796 [Candidatus Rifleibacterium amylolyticum]|nr:MAG: hypothetical protein GQF41_1796 [Candidatus Rifleibacterium amylolyticum]
MLRSKSSKSSDENFESMQNFQAEITGNVLAATYQSEVTV